MDEINIRFKELRKACEKTQTEWGNILGLSRSGISEIESGRRKVTEKHIKFLEVWSEKHVNVNWLRTGEGRMFLRRGTNDIISDFMTDLLNKDDESYKKRLIVALARMKEEDWNTIITVAKKWVND